MATLLGIVALLAALVFGGAVFLLLIGGGVLIARRSKSIVPAGVRKRLNADLDRALEEQELAQIKQRWMVADGWDVSAE